jgi:hypothetical protein
MPINSIKQDAVGCWHKAAGPMSQRRLTANQFVIFKYFKTVNPVTFANT